MIKIRCYGFLVFSKLGSVKSFLQLAETSSIRVLISRVEMIQNGHIHPSKELIHAILGRKLTVITTFMRETSPADTLSRD